MVYFMLTISSTEGSTIFFSHLKVEKDALYMAARSTLLTEHTHPL